MERLSFGGVSHRRLLVENACKEANEESGQTLGGSVVVPDEEVDDDRCYFTHDSYDREGGCTHA